jgi:hypothetical protein
MMHRSTGRFSPRARSWAWLRAALRPAVCAPLVIALIVPLVACDKPKEAECRKAITNIRKIYGTEDNTFGVSPEAMVRACQGSASPESVRCFIQASSVEDLQNCEGEAFKEMFEGEEATPAATPEATPEARPEATPEARPEATGQEALPEATGQEARPGVAPEGEQQGGEQGAPAPPDPGSGQ